MKATTDLLSFLDVPDQHVLERGHESSSAVEKRIRARGRDEAKRFGSTVAEIRLDHLPLLVQVPVELGETEKKTQKSFDFVRIQHRQPIHSAIHHIHHEHASHTPRSRKFAQQQENNKFPRRIQLAQ